MVMQIYRAGGGGGVGISGTPVANNIARFTDAKTIEGIAYSILMAALSGQAGAAFSWNGQNLTGVGALTLSGTLTTTNDILISGRGQPLQITSDTYIVFNAQVHSDTAANTVIFRGNRSRGSGASKAAVENNDVIMMVDARPYDGDGFDGGAGIRFLATQTHTATAHGQKILFYTVSNDAVGQSLRMTIDHNGLVTIAQGLTVVGTTTLATALTGVLRADSGVVSVDADVTDIVSDLVGDSGSGGTAGLAPAPGAGDAAAGKYLKADGVWTTPAGGGDVVGPASSTDNEIARQHSTTGKVLQTYTSNPPTISDTGDVNIDGDLDVENIVVSGTVDGKDVSGLATAAESVAAVEAAGLTFAENKGIILDAVLSADEKWSGITEAGTAGAALAVGDLVYLASTGKWLLAKADAAATSSGQLGMVVLAANGDTDPTNVLVYGKIRSATLPALTVGAPVYISAATAGDAVVAAPTGTTNFVVRIIGYGATAEDLFFCPDNTYLELA